MGLGQTELFEPPAQTRVLRRSGFGWCGVDPSTQRCAVAAVDEDGDRRASVVSFPTRGSLGLRLHAIYEAVEGELRARYRDSGVVIVEQPSGRQPNPPLSYAVGATLAAVGAAYADGEVPWIDTVSSSRWKKIACGAGNIYKPKPGAEEPYGVLTWAQANGYEGSSWDECDAWGVCEYARKTYEIVRR